jgi:hypothetical protein
MGSEMNGKGRSKGIGLRSRTGSAREHRAVGPRLNKTWWLDRAAQAVRLHAADYSDVAALLDIIHYFVVKPL